MKPCEHCGTPYQVSATKTDRDGNYIDEPACECYSLLAAWRLREAEDERDELARELKNAQHLLEQTYADRDRLAQGYALLTADAEKTMTTRDQQIADALTLLADAIDGTTIGYIEIDCGGRVILHRRVDKIGETEGLPKEIAPLIAAGTWRQKIGNHDQLPTRHAP